MINELALWADRISRFEVESKRTLGKIESSKTRSISLDESYVKLGSLSLVQDDLFRQALRCVEQEVYRAAHVMSWSATIDFLLDICDADKFEKLNDKYDKWSIRSKSELREQTAEFNIIEAMFACKYITKAEKKGFHGLLNRRNECAHPSEYFPGLNETLGFIGECFKRIEKLQN